jgi:hypothetical protein
MKEMFQFIPLRWSVKTGDLVYVYSQNNVEEPRVGVYMGWVPGVVGWRVFACGEVKIFSRIWYRCATIGSVDE